jgi:hypothetical protein
MAAGLKATSPKKAKPSKPKILIYGRPGVGKTWGSLDFPQVYYIDCEAGANLDHYTDKLEKSGGVYLGPSDGANDFAVVNEQIIALATTQHPYTTLVIDSFTKLFNTAIQIEHDRMVNDKRDMTKTFGAEKKPAIAATRRMIRWFEKLDMNVILICHQKDKWQNGEVVGSTFDGWDKLEYELHLAMEIVAQGKSRKARVAKTRLAQFAESEMFDWSYEEFASRYGAEVIESASTHTEPATDAQVKAVEGLLGIVKIDDPDKVILKWFEKAGVERFGQMDAPTIQKCIDFLQKKIPTSTAA